MNLLRTLRPIAGWLQKSPSAQAIAGAALAGGTLKLLERGAPVVRDGAERLSVAGRVAWRRLAAAVGGGDEPGPTEPDPELKRYYPPLSPDRGREWSDTYGGIRQYKTPKADAVPPPTGWLSVRAPRVGFLPGLDITPLPLVDSRTGLFARLPYREAKLRAAELGGRLPTYEEAQQIWERGARISPTSLIRGAPLSSRDFDLERMQSLRFAHRHDKSTVNQIASSDWSGDKPVANAGKWWVDGAPAGRAWLYGWWHDPKNPKPTQSPNGPSGQGPHDDEHFDYGTLTYVVFPTRAVAGPSGEVFETHNPAGEADPVLADPTIIPPPRP